MSTIAVAAFYRFMPISDLAGVRDRILAACGEEIRGTLLLAPEGLNGTLSGSPEALEAALQDISRAVGAPDLRPRVSMHDRQPFRRLKVRIKREIVTLGETVDPQGRGGIRVAPEQWNAILRDGGIPVLDVRNGFEHAIGTFQGAIDTATKAFGDFPRFVDTQLDPKRHKSVAMFCTGGIRCEKASALMRDRGFETVYQLDGGILAYLAAVPPEDSLWRGGCFVFDERVALGPGLVAQPVALCAVCSQPLVPSRHGDTPSPRCAACDPQDA